MRFLLKEVRSSQEKLDAAIAEAKSLPDSDLTKSAKITRYNALQREIKITFRDLGGKTDLWANQSIPRFYSEGFTIAGAELDVGYDFTLVHRDAVEVMVKDTQDDVGGGLQQISASFNDKIDTQRSWEQLSTQKLSSIRSGGKSAVTQQLLLGRDVKETARDLRDDLWEDGVEIVDRSGRRWQMETYTRMLVRTKSAMAFNGGSLNKFAEEGVGRVRVFDGVVDDQDCARANGQIWTVKYAMNHVISHPNCRRAFGPLPGDGVLNKADPKEIAVAGAKVGLRLTQIIQLVKTLNQWRLQKGVLDLSEEVFGLRRVLDFEAEHFETLRIAAFIDEIERYLEDVFDPAAKRVGLIDEIPDHIPADWIAVRRKIEGSPALLRNYVEEVKIRGVEDGLLFPADDLLPTPPSASNYFDVEEFGEVFDILTSVGEKGFIPVATNFDTRFHAALQVFISTIDEAEQSELMRIMRSPINRSESFFDYVRTLNITQEDAFGQLDNWFSDIIEKRLSFSHEVVLKNIEQPEAIFGFRNWHAVFELDEDVFKSSGLFDILGTGQSNGLIDMHIIAQWRDPLSIDGINWLDQGLDPAQLYDTLRALFGNVTRLPDSGINGTIWVVVGPSGGEFAIKQIRGIVTASGALGVVLSEEMTNVIIRRLGLPIVEHRWLPSAVAGQVFDIMTVVPDSGNLYESGRVLNREWARKWAFFDTVTAEADGHRGQYLIRWVSGDGFEPSDLETIAYHIDRETSFRVGHLDGTPGSQLSAQETLYGVDSFPGNRYREEVVDAVLDDTLPEVFPDRPITSTLNITEEESISLPREIPTLFDELEDQHSIAPGQLVTWGRGGSNPILYLTKTETDFVDDLIEGAIDLNKELTDFSLDAVESLPNGWFVGQSPLLTANDEADDLVFEMIEQTRERVRRMVDDGFLVRDAITEVQDFGTGLGRGQTIRIGEFAELIDVDGNRFGGIVYQIYEASDGETVVKLIDGFRDIVPRADVNLVSLRQSAFPKVFDDFLDQVVDPDLYRVGEALDYSPPLASFDAHKTSAQERVVKVAKFDEFGIQEGFTESYLTIDDSFVEIVHVDGVPVSAEDMARTAREILKEELAFIAPEYRPRSVRLLTELATTKDEKLAQGVFYTDGSRHLDLSLQTIFDEVGEVKKQLPVDMDDLRWDKFRELVRHELSHGITDAVDTRYRSEIGKRIIEEILDDPDLPVGLTWRELDRRLEPLVVGSIEDGETAIAALVRERTDLVMQTINDAREIEVKAFLKEGVPDWAKYPDEIARGKRKRRLVEEFAAEAFAASREMAPSSIVPPSGLGERLYWGLFNDERVIALVRKDISLPAPLSRWEGVKDVHKSSQRFLLKPVEDAFDPDLLRRKVQDNGGFTYDVVTGNEPTSGYVAALKKNEKIIEDWSTLTREEQLKIFREYRNSKANDTKKLLDSESWYMGGWYEEFDDAGKRVDRFYLDVSQNVLDEWDAVRFGIKEEQITVWNVNAFDTIVLRDANDVPIYTSAQDYILRTKPQASARSENRISILQGKRKINGEEVIVVFEDAAAQGKHASMGTQSLPDDLADRVVAAAKNRYTLIDDPVVARDAALRVDPKNQKPIEITVESITTNYRKVFEQARRAYAEDPDLRAQDVFYDFWQRVMIETEEAVGIKMPRIAAAVAAMSPSLDAEDNLRRAIRFAHYVGEDRTVPSVDVIKIQTALNEVVEALRAEGMFELAERYSFRVTVNTKQSELPAEVAFIFFRTIFSRETGLPFGVPKRNEFFERSIKILRGELAPDEGLGNSKVRSFFNNTIDPRDEFKWIDSTIDFHMANMGGWVIGFGNTKRIDQDMIINPRTGKIGLWGMGGRWDVPGRFGVSLGLRPLMADGLQTLFNEIPSAILSELQIHSVAELQEVLWATWRRGLKLGWWGELPRIIVRGGSGSL